MSEADPSQEAKNLRQLLHLLGTPTIQDLEELVADEVEPRFCNLVTDASDDTYLEVNVFLVPRGAQVILEFPLTVERFWTEISDLDSTATALWWCVELAESIREIEGIDVQVDLNHGWLPSARWAHPKSIALLDGCFVQPCDEYPYKRPMNGDRTVEDWLRIRIDRHLPGFDVTDELGRPLVGATTLRELRGTDAEHPIGQSLRGARD